MVATAGAQGDDGWDPSWDTPEGASTASAQPQSWEGFFQDCTQRSEAAMRAAGIDPRKPVKAAVSRSGAALRGGLPADGQLSCFGCDSPCAGRYECAQCLEIYRARAVVAARDYWERAFFCGEACFQTHWHVAWVHTAPATHPAPTAPRETTHASTTSRRPRGAARCGTRSASSAWKTQRCSECSKKVHQASTANYPSSERRLRRSAISALALLPARLLRLLRRRHLLRRQPQVDGPRPQLLPPLSLSVHPAHVFGSLVHAPAVHATQLAHRSRALTAVRQQPARACALGAQRGHTHSAGHPKPRVVAPADVQTQGLLLLLSLVARSAPPRVLQQRLTLCKPPVAERRSLLVHRVEVCEQPRGQGLAMRNQPGHPCGVHPQGVHMPARAVLPPVPAELARHVAKWHPAQRLHSHRALVHRVLGLAQQHQGRGNV